MGRINQLAEKTTLNSTDVIAVDAGAGGNTNKMTGANLAGQLKALGNYQDKLTFDSAPTAGSTNPVTSGGVKTALDGKQNTLTFDSTPTAGSTNPVTSGGVANAIAQSTATLEISSGTATEVKALTTSGTYFEYTVPTSGWYTVRATSANTSGSGYARIAVGNTIIMHVSASLGQYDQLLPSPMFLKAGTSIKGMAGFPANGGGSILKIS